ncbi:M56 family metallopeptidase [Massilia yuzhufengensis]|uniref:D-alanyl-D-alanine endopeptidase (Penicillin-binding protein 7) n=1 Tax=Massilia yuzhufengensis TaxID=1164594 RepID=A0A1I1JFT0_9BURK|nr:M56 family metallopeptidase [Massilia yuzhufengensis]SFC47316.1 D-alanyl-D-alanine endopeptidase (penicillin-binding protein 7) [Massilia yuzhufengensis]
MNAADLVAGVGWTLVHFLWQGALIGCATAVLLTALRNARPESRYLAACTGLFLCLAWPATELVLRLQGSAGAGGDAMVLFAAGLVAGSPLDDSWSVLLGEQLSWVVGTWAVCTLAMALRMVLGLLWIGRAAAHERIEPAWQARIERMAGQFGIDRAVRLRVVERLGSPITAGWWRPVVLVPAALVSGMPAHLLEALLAHEMAHIKRHDYLVNLGQNVVETILFYHPAVWWISGRIRVEREQIADDFAARQLGEPRRLALALSELERLQFSTHHLAQAANGGDLMSRIKRLIRPDTQALNWKAAIPVLGLAALCSAVFAHAAPTPKSAEPDLAAVADFNSCKRPHYPAESIKQNHTGTVTLGFLVAKNGKVKEAKLAKSSGHVLLDDAARIALEKCRFKPARTKGKPVESWTAVQYVWTLE